jgi:predicted metal-dependent phosphotriesterase family hydrolase
MPEDLAQRTESERGCWTYLSDVGLDRLRELGVTDEQIGQMTVDNPRRLFETRDLGGY